MVREPPAYQEYAATMLADRRFRRMTLAERGLLYTLRLECWANEFAPRDPAELAKVLSFSQTEIEAALPAVMRFFAVRCVGEEIYSPELEDYRIKLADARDRQAAGGRRSAKKRKDGRPKDGTGDDPSTLEAPSKQPSSSFQGRRQVKTKPNQSKTSPCKALAGDGADECQTANGCDADEYRRSADGE